MNADYSIIVTQQTFASSITDIPLTPERARHKLSPVTDEERSAMRSTIGKLNWLAGISRPDLSFEVCQFSSKVTQAVVEDIVQLIKIVHRAKKHDAKVIIPQLDFSTVQITIYTDSNLNNLPNGGSQEGHIVFLSDKDNNYVPISWVSQRIQRVVRSTLAAEAVSLNNACDDGVFLGRILNGVLGNSTPLPIVAYTDNKSTHDSINSSTSVSDKKLRLEIGALREYQEKKTIDIRKVPGKENISDVLTKRGASSRSLLAVITSGKFPTDVMLHR